MAVGRKTVRAVIDLVGLLIAGWCVMTVTHECGHILAGLLAGGKLAAYDLRPWSLPFSLFSTDPFPLVTLWAGPILGVVVPVGIACLIRRRWTWFLAAFCAVANGAYLAAGWLSGDTWLDTTKLLEHGAWPVAIAGYCVATIGWGYPILRREIFHLFETGSSGLPTGEPTLPPTTGP
jgi:hypothetical protein